MPLYEYDCRACGAHVEILVRSGDRPACPSCRSTDLERTLSLFGVSSESTRRANLQAGKKQQAKKNRDKVIADHEEAHHSHDH
jgi:putative FmdB family regulatory protein